MSPSRSDGHQASIIGNMACQQLPSIQVAATRIPRGRARHASDRRNGCGDSDGRGVDGDRGGSFLNGYACIAEKTR